MGDSFDRFRVRERGRFGDDPIRGNASARSDLVDLTLCRHHQTDRAILVSSDGDETTATWLPLSVVEVVALGRSVAGRRRDGRPVTVAVVEVTLPERIAVERGLL
jgi:hypothetical protein